MVATANLTCSSFSGCGACGWSWSADVIAWPTSRESEASGATFSCRDEPRSA